MMNTTRLRKGTNICFNPQGCSSSIPVKYQTLVITNEDKKGFNSKSKRFIPQDHLNENPGPGAYLSHTPAEVISPSFSKKGTGGFASQALRVSRNRQRYFPGPDTYNLQSSLLPRQTYLRGSTRNFRLPIAVPTHSEAKQTPAPNQYNVTYNGIDRSTTSAQSVFISKTLRNAINLGSFKGPSPCQYNVTDSITQKDPKVPFSCFKSTVVRNALPARPDGPGPGAYNPFVPPDPVRRTLLPRRHFLGLSAPPLKLPRMPPPPGPGQYDIVNYDGEPKQFMSSAVFVSGTCRWGQDGKGQNIPGPGFYDPEHLSKRSFIYNHGKGWIPV